MPLPTMAANDLAGLNAALAELNAVVLKTNREMVPAPVALGEIKPADWDSPVWLSRDKSDKEDPYL